MKNPDQKLDFVRAIHGEGAQLDAEKQERLRRWEEAFERWLKVRNGSVARTVARDNRRAWVEFLSLCRKAPWEVRAEDVQGFMEAMEGRGLRMTTISRQLSGLSLFFDTCGAEGIDPQAGRDFNPVKEVKRPQAEEYERARAMSRKEEARLLEAMRGETSPSGKRDLALFTLLLRSGWEAGKARKLKWGEVREAKDRESKRLPEEAWQTIVEYLEAAGRLEGMRAEDYIFAARAITGQEPGGKAEDWDGTQPVSSDQVRYLLKQYARWAGLREGKITCHTLRHTAAMRQMEAKRTEAEIQDFLGMKSLGKTREYLRRLKAKPRGRLRKRGKAGGEDTTGSRVGSGKTLTPAPLPAGENHRWERGKEAGGEDATGSKQAGIEKLLMERRGEKGMSEEDLEVLRRRAIIRRLARLLDDKNNKFRFHHLDLLGRTAIQIARILAWKKFKGIGLEAMEDEEETFDPE